MVLQTQPGTTVLMGRAHTKTGPSGGTDGRDPRRGVLHRGLPPLAVATPHSALVQAYGCLVTVTDAGAVLEHVALVYLLGSVRACPLLRGNS